MASSGCEDVFGGCVKKGGLDMEGFGYAFEQVVLYATALGPWHLLAGRHVQAKRVCREAQARGRISACRVAGGLRIPEEIADRKGGGCGRARARASALARCSLTARQRGRSCRTTGAGNLPEMVRIGPSASNRQRRVIVKDRVPLLRADRQRYAGNTMYGFTMQRIDRHCGMPFRAERPELGLPGGFAVDDPHLYPISRPQKAGATSRGARICSPSLSSRCSKCGPVRTASRP